MSYAASRHCAGGVFSTLESPKVEWEPEPSAINLLFCGIRSQFGFSGFILQVPVDHCCGPPAAISLLDSTATIIISSHISIVIIIITVAVMAIISYISIIIIIAAASRNIKT